MRPGISHRFAIGVPLFASSLVLTTAAEALERLRSADAAPAGVAVTPPTCEVAGRVDEPPAWTLSALVGGAVLRMELPGYGNSIVAPAEIGIARRLGPVRLGAYGAGASGLSIMTGSSKGVTQWHVGGILEIPFAATPTRAGWVAIKGGYTALEADVAHAGPELGLSGGIDRRVADRTTIGPFLDLNVATVDGGSIPLGGSVQEQPAVLVAWAAVGARVTFDGL